MMTALPFSHPLRLSDLRRSGGAEFDLQPDATARAAIAEALGISAVRKLRLVGRLVPEGRDDWQMSAELGATVVQPCVVTLAPVTSRIDEPVARRWVKGLQDPTGDEVEMPDDEVEPLGQVIDLGAVLVEALALALPPWPRAEGVATPESAPEPDGPTTTRRPFAGLGALRDRLAAEEPDGGDPAANGESRNGNGPRGKN
jgi:uncharacterized metal-binding protein YceD (DUF177 family)